MIKAIVLDIDGVIVGTKEGQNFPHPSQKVSSALRKIHDKGIPVSFLTAKPAFAAAENIKAVGIDNPHIADGGATVFNPIRNQIIQSNAIPTDTIVQLLRSLPNNTNVDLFSSDGYYHQASLKNEFTMLYTNFVGRAPVFTDDLEAVAKKERITKINIIAFNDKEKEMLNDIVKNSSKSYSFNWSSNPYLKPARILVVTAKGSSKRSGVEVLANYLNVPFDDILGIGDTLHDWDFLEICGYKAAMENATQELKEKINLRDPQHVIGGHVDEDGILDVFKYFKLLP